MEAETEIRMKGLTTSTLTGRVHRRIAVVTSPLHSLTLGHRKIVHFAYAGSRRNAQRRRSESAAGRGRRHRARAFWPDGGLTSPHRRLTGERPMGDEDFRAQRVRALLHPGKDVRRACPPKNSGSG